MVPLVFLGVLGMGEVEEIIEVFQEAEGEDDVRQIEEKLKVENKPLTKQHTTTFVLSDIILREWFSYGFVSAITYGRQGTGKSIYNIKVAYDVLKALGFHITWKQLIDDYVYFDIMDIVDRLQRVGDTRLPVLVWDDAGVHGSSYLWFVNRAKVMLVSALFQTARTILNALLLNAPNPGFVMKNLRSVDSYIVLVVKAGEGKSRAHGYKLKIFPSGMHRVEKVFIDEFKRSLPVYDYYLSKRRMYTKYVLEEIAKVMREEAREEQVPQSRPKTKYEQIAELLRQGYTYRQISEKLKVSTKTIAKVKKMMDTVASKQP